jgi:hypothetical protein
MANHFKFFSESQTLLCYFANWTNYALNIKIVKDFGFSTPMLLKLYSLNSKKYYCLVSDFK